MQNKKCKKKDSSQRVNWFLSRWWPWQAMWVTKLRKTQLVRNLLLHHHHLLPFLLSIMFSIMFITGTISKAEAREALRKHKGNIWASVTECVEGRQQKVKMIFMMMMRRRRRGGTLKIVQGMWIWINNAKIGLKWCANFVMVDIDVVDIVDSINIVDSVDIFKTIWITSESLLIPGLSNLKNVTH